LTSRQNNTDNVIIANMGSINKGKTLLNTPTYAGVAEDFDHTYRAQLLLPVDIWSLPTPVSISATKNIRPDKLTQQAHWSTLRATSTPY